MKEGKVPALNSAEKNKKSAITISSLIVCFVVSTFFTKYNPLEIFFNMNNFWDFLINDFFPPKLNESGEIFKGLISTVCMAMCATLFATVVAMMLAFLGSKHTCPWEPLRKIIRGVASIFRNIPNVIWVFILIMSFGIGNIVGVLALFIQSTGFLTRAFIETIDETGEEAVEALKSIGAGKPTIAIQAVIPACIQGIISWILYGIEVNVRSSTLVGAVGGGGIGLIMMGYIKLFRYHSASAVILMIAAVVVMIDLITNFLRKKVFI